MILPRRPTVPSPVRHHHGRPGARHLGPILAFTALAILMAPATGGSQTLPRRPASDPLARVRVGDWVQLDGTIGKDLSISCDEVRLLTGDFLDDDWCVAGMIRSIDTGKHEFTVAGLRISVKENTQFESPSRTLRRFADLKTGMPIDVEGTYRRGGAFLAAEVDDESDEPPRVRGNPNRLRVVGRVERVDLRKRTITALGMVFRLTERTPFRSVIE